MIASDPGAGVEALDAADEFGVDIVFILSSVWRKVLVVDVRVRRGVEQSSQIFIDEWFRKVHAGHASESPVVEVDSVVGLGGTDANSEPPGLPADEAGRLRLIAGSCLGIGRRIGTGRAGVTVAAISRVTPQR